MLLLAFENVDILAIEVVIGVPQPHFDGELGAVVLGLQERVEECYESFDLTIPSQNSQIAIFIVKLCCFDCAVLVELVGDLAIVDPLICVVSVDSLVQIVNCFFVVNTHK